jgi:hypothetical protein
MPIRPKCRDCRFVDMTPYLYARACCRINPPIVLIGDHGHAITRWPEVDPDKDYCGSHEIAIAQGGTL